MARIKSALEIALERTESVKSDKASISLFEAKQKGKKLANEFLDSSKESIDSELSAVIKKYPKDEQASLKQGIFDVLISALVLPDSEADLNRVEIAFSGLKDIINNSKFNNLAKQTSQVLRQFMDESSQYEEAIKRQYAPKLKQKEEEISRHMGRPISLDPFQDPEFVAFYNQNMSAIKANYSPVIDEVRNAAQQFFQN